MFNYTKIKELAKKQGIKLSYITDQIGIGQTYFSDTLKRNGDIPDERMDIIAAILHTTPAYLRDQTDDPLLPEEKEKSPLIYSEDEKSLIDLYRRVPADKRDLVVEMIRLALKKD